jgi:hypothetical protein
MGELHTATNVTSKLCLPFKSANPMQKEQFKAPSQHIEACLTPRVHDAAASARLQNAESFVYHVAARSLFPLARNPHAPPELAILLMLLPLPPQKTATCKGAYTSRVGHHPVLWRNDKRHRDLHHLALGFSRCFDQLPVNPSCSLGIARLCKFCCLSMGRLIACHKMQCRKRSIKYSVSVAVVSATEYHILRMETRCSEMKAFWLYVVSCCRFRMGGGGGGGGKKQAFFH